MDLIEIVCSLGLCELYLYPLGNQVSADLERGKKVLAGKFLKGSGRISGQILVGYLAELTGHLKKKIGWSLP